MRRQCVFQRVQFQGVFQSFPNWNEMDGLVSLSEVVSTFNSIYYVDPSGQCLFVLFFIGILKVNTVILSATENNNGSFLNEIVALPCNEIDHNSRSKRFQ